MSTSQDHAAVEPEIMEAMAPSAVEALVRGEIDVQIATAKRYPRSLEIFQKRAVNMATLDDETAESCLYRRPVGKKKNDKGRWEEEYAEGMSIRMAEIVGSSYGNLRVYSMLVEQTQEFVRARGMALDLETNFASSSEVIESTLKQDGTPYSARMRIVVAKACLSKARRDATFQVVPRALAKPVELAVRKLLLGDAQSIEKRRVAAVQWITKIGILEARVYAALGIEGPADLTAEKLVELTGLKTAIRDKEIGIDEAFPELEGPQPAQRKSQQPAPSAPASAPAAAAAAQAPVAPTAPAKPADAPNVGVILEVARRGDGALIKLSTKFQAATRNPEFIRAADALKASGTRVEIATKPASDPTKFAPNVTEILPLGTEA